MNRIDSRLQNVDGNNTDCLDLNGHSVQDHIVEAEIQLFDEQKTIGML